MIDLCSCEEWGPSGFRCKGLTDGSCRLRIAAGKLSVEMLQREVNRLWLELYPEAPAPLPVSWSPDSIKVGSKSAWVNAYDFYMTLDDFSARILEPLITAQIPKQLCPHGVKLGMCLICEREAKQTEKVNHPSYYGGNTPYEVIKVLEAWLTPEEFRGALKFNIIKYTARAEKKGQLEDHEKALWYQNYLVDWEKRITTPAYPQPQPIDEKKWQERVDRAHPKTEEEWKNANKEHRGAMHYDDRCVPRYVENTVDWTQK